MRRFLPSLSALQAFDSAARHMSFTRAAEDLLLTQSGISRQITNLESYLGVRLFERVGSRLVLTDAGKSYAADVRHTLDQLEEISIDAVRGRKANTALLIGTQTTIGARWLIPRLAGFHTAHPEVPVEILELQPDSSMTGLPIDTAILRGLGTWPDARSVELFREELVVVGAPSLVSQTDFAKDIDFRTIPTLHNAQRPSLWLTWLHITGRSFDGAIQGLRFPQSEMLIRAAVEGLGFAVVPRPFVEKELAEGRLLTCFGAPVESGEAYWLVIPDHKVDRGQVTLFRNWLLKQRRGG